MIGERRGCGWTGDVESYIRKKRESVGVGEWIGIVEKWVGRWGEKGRYKR